MCRMISTCVGLDVCSLLQQFLHKVLLRQDKLLVEMSTEEKDDLSLRATSITRFCLANEVLGDVVDICVMSQIRELIMTNLS